MILLALLAASAFPASAAHAKNEEPDPRYQPTQSLLEINAVLRRHVPDDTYRFPPARDFTGRNVYRSSLLRLENLERAHEAALRAGTWSEVLPFAKGRALERLRAYAVAAASYRRAAAAAGELAEEARRSAAVCDALAAATRRAPRRAEPASQAPVAIASPATDAAPEQNAAGAAVTVIDARVALPAGAEADPEDAVATPAGEAGPPLAPRDPLLAEREARIEEIGARRSRLEELLERVAGTHYAAVAREEIERNDRERARLFVASRALFPDGDVRALAALQRLAVEHKQSKNANAHVLELADLYATLAREYVEAFPPESPDFEPTRFEELVSAAARLYETVSNQDGATEKLEAARRLEAFLAFTLKVDRDRFTP